MDSKLSGSIDQIYFDAGQLVIEGWAILNGRPVLDGFIVEINQISSTFEKKTVPRRDIANFLGEDALNSGFIIRVKRYFSAFSYPSTIKVSILGSDDLALRINPNSIYHQFPDILTNVPSFWKHVQNPGSRVKHEGTLVFLARNAIAFYRRNPPVQAAALCVLVWRDLLSQSSILNFAKTKRFSDYLLNRIDKASDPSSVRWYVSLANAMAFLAIKANKPLIGSEFFKRIVTKTASMEGTWLCAPNGLSARFMLGYLALASEDLIAAHRHMSQAVTFFESRCAHFEVHNFWSFDELLETTRLSQQALVVRELIEMKGDSPRLNFNADLDLSRITTQLIDSFLKRNILMPLKVRPLLERTPTSDPGREVT